MSSTSAVRLIAVTKPVDEEFIDMEALLAYMARVSSPNQENPEIVGLLNYMIEHEHWSPYEMCNMVVEIQTSRAISQQILRHRSFSFQEFSQRYAAATEAIVYPARRQDTKNRQNSLNDLDLGTVEWFDRTQNYIYDEAFAYYKLALEKGIAKESARSILPLGTKTKMYMNGTLRSWIHYLNLRTGNGTQLEHQEIALAIKDIFVAEYPVISEALGWLVQIPKCPVCDQRYVICDDCGPRPVGEW